MGLWARLLIGELLARSSGVCFSWATGRASASQDLTAEEYEEVFGFLYDLSKTAHSTSRPPKPSTIADTSRNAVRRKASTLAQHGDAPEVIQRQAGINDGKGFVFVSHTGEIFPSGFLPLAAGNVHRDSLPPCTGSRRFPYAPRRG